MVEELQEFCHSVMLPWIVELAAILSFAYCCYHRGAECKMYICLLCYNKPTESKFKKNQCFSIDLSKSERDC